MTVRSSWIMATLAIVSATLVQVVADSPRKEAVTSFASTLTQVKLFDPKSNQPTTLAELAAGKPVAVVFLSTVCPVNNAYIVRLNQLHKEFASKGVVLVGVNANHADTAAEVVAHTAQYEIAFPVLRDVGQQLADALGAKRNPEAIVLTKTGELFYRGRIDDQFSVEAKKLKSNTNELGDALAALVAGKEPEVRETPVSGCLISRAPKPKPNASVTYTKHIAPLMQAHCQECHRPGQIGPMSFLSYDDVSGWSEMIREVVSERRMPPWYADPNHGTFSNDRSMKKADVETLIRWIDDGCPQGDPKDEPVAKSFPDVWKIGKPDLVLTMEEEYNVPAEMPKRGVPYQLFFVDPGFKDDMWVQMAEARAGVPEVVHHILVYIAPPPEKIDPTMPDFPFLPGVKNARVLCGTAPGDMPMMFPDGVAIKVPAGSTLIFQMHYTPNGKAAKDRSSIGLKFAKRKPDRAVVTVPVFNPRIRIAPGDSNYQIESFFTFKYDAKIYSFMPHMHVRGKDFRINLRDADGKESTVLNVPKYNFNWQNVYRLSEPIAVKKGSGVHCIAHYDNSVGNPLNPDPNKWIGWGDQTWEEMMIGWMDMVYELPAE